MKSPSMISDEDDNMGEEIDFIEESLEESGTAGARDMLASGSNDKIQFQHYNVKDPVREEAKKEVKKQLGAIQPKFEDYTVKKENTNTKNMSAKRVERPGTAKGARGASGVRPATALSAKTTTKAKPPAKEPTEKDIENSRKAAQRLKEAKQAKKAAEEEALANVPKKKKVEPAKVKEKIKETKEMKNK